MTRELALVIIIGVAVALLGLLWWAWRRRVRRDSGLVAPVGDFAAGTAALATFAGLYVATTAHGDPLERLAIKGLSFRSKTSIIVTDAGVALDIPGQQRIVIAAETIVSVASATVAIDRVVEPGGLARISWRISNNITTDGNETNTTVDTYLRPQNTSTRALVEAISPLVSTSTPLTGAEA